MTTTPNTVEALIDQLVAALKTAILSLDERNHNHWEVSEAIEAGEKFFADRAQRPTVAGSVDTPEYRKLLGEVIESGERGYSRSEADEERWIAANSALISHINARLAPAAPSVTPAAPVVAEGLDQAKYQNLRWRDGHEARVAAHPVAGSPAEAEPKYGPVETVADMVRNLRTLDQAAPIFAAFHVDYQGKRCCRTRPISTSWERVIDGKWVDPTRKDVPYAVIVWAGQDERAAEPMPASETASDWTVGNLLTMSDSDYPGMGSVFGQIWQGDDLIARVYGDSADEVRERAARIAAPAAPTDKKG